MKKGLSKRQKDHLGYFVKIHCQAILSLQQLILHQFKLIMKIRLLLLTILLASACFGLKAQTDDRDLEAVEKTLRAYMDGASLGDSTLFASAFHPDGQMTFIRDGKMNVVPLREFMTRTKNGNKTDRKNRIVSIQIQGTSAQARLEVETPEVIFHDFMSLLKTPEGWKIVSKVFHREDKKKPGS